MYYKCGIKVKRINTSSIPTIITCPISGDCSSFFNITSTGEIVTVKPIDRDGDEIKAKYDVCTFPIEVSQKYNKLCVDLILCLLFPDDNYVRNYFEKNALNLYDVCK